MSSILEFRTRFPEFTTVADERVQLFLDDAELLMGTETRWLKYYDVAQEYHTAHLLVVAQVQALGDSAPLNPVSHQEVDDVTIKSAVGNSVPTAEDVWSTSYGKRYAQYRKICFAGPIGV